MRNLGTTRKATDSWQQNPAKLESLAIKGELLASSVKQAAVTSISGSYECESSALRLDTAACLGAHFHPAFAVRRSQLRVLGQN